MSGVKFNVGVVNYGGTPSIGANTSANRPAAGVKGRLFVDTTNSLLQYDTGSAWTTIGSGGGGITGTGAAGQGTFWSGATSVSGDNAFFWDNTNKRLGLGTITPGVRLDIHGTGVLQQLNGTATNNAYLDFQNAGATQWRIGNFYNGATQQFVLINGLINQVITLTQGGNLLLNNTTAGSDGVTIGTDQNLSWSQGSNNESYANIFRQRNTAATIIGNGVKRSNTGDFASSFSTSVARSAIALSYNSGSIAFFSNPASTVASGTDITLTERMTILTSGFVGINYTSPAVMLAVSGSVYQGSNVANSNFQMLCNQNFYTVGFSPNFSTYTAATVNISVSSNLGTGYVFKTTAAIAVNLPAATGLNNQLYFVVLTGTTVTVNRAGSDVIINNLGASVTSLTLVGHTKTLLYCDGGTTWYQLF
jgi:hypothetical protein